MIFNKIKLSATVTMRISIKLLCKRWNVSNRFHFYDFGELRVKLFRCHMRKHFFDVIWHTHTT